MACLSLIAVSRTIHNSQHPGLAFCKLIGKDDIIVNLYVINLQHKAKARIGRPSSLRIVARSRHKVLKELLHILSKH